jgi:hypothetical protein
MQRPTCKTCPYWLASPEYDDKPATEGWCERYPPTLMQFAATEKDQSNTAATWAWTQPKTSDAGTCGEHPDFPAYIAWRATQDRRTA